VTPDTAAVSLVAATWLHAGFQLVVTLVVYPAFPEVRAEDWRRHHGAHSRRITPVVVLVYGLVVATCAWTVARGLSDVVTVLAVASSGVTLLVTGMLAGPAHRRLTTERTTGNLAALRWSDRVRCTTASISAVAAGWALMT